MINSSSSFTDSKKHFLILDALRGVAALVVVLFHVLEYFAGGDHVKQIINHGYLAVDFFFMLSGYVMAHAYDDRWDRMSLTDFFKRRIIRLQPMIVVGMIIGALLFYLGESSVFPKVAETPLWSVLLLLLIGCTLIPVPPSMDIRGWDEMHPLDGPAWSLFFEYIANILHALVLRKLSKLVLGILVALAGAALIHLAVTSPQGDVIGGWSVTPEQLRIGFTRLLFPYMAGMLLRRSIRVLKTRSTFVITSLLLVFVLSFPRIGGSDHVWANGLYDSLVIILIFPIIIYLGAIGEVKRKATQKLCTFLGDISYPIYIIHYPFIYALYAWFSNNNISFATGAWAGIGLTIGMVILSYVLLKWYDEPVRTYLARRFMNTKKH